MAFTVRDLMEQDLFPGIKLAAGADGIDTPITWVNIMEILDSPDTVNRGELLITTGYDLDNEKQYPNLVQRLKSRGIPALVIQTGYYISGIPAYIVEAADTYSLPVLEMPSRYSFSCILHILMDALSKDRELWSHFRFEQEKLQAAFRDRLRQSVQQESGSSHPFYLLLFTVIHGTDTDPSVIENGFSRLHSFVASYAGTCIAESAENSYMAVSLSFQDPGKEAALTYDLQIQLTFLSENDGLNFYAACDRFFTMDELSDAYSHCLQCLTLLDQVNAKRGVCCYEDYAFIRMFSSYYSRDRSFYMENKVLQQLLEKDRKDQTHLVQTLRVYLAENCSITHAADRLFIHRHTMMNRIQMIRDLTGINLDDYYQRIYFSISLLMHDYFAL